MQLVEKLPVEIRGKGGHPNYLRIKARNHKKKWTIRYIRKVHRDEALTDWKYRTELETEGRTLEKAAELMIEKLKIVLPGRMRQDF